MRSLQRLALANEVDETKLFAPEAPDARPGSVIHPAAVTGFSYPLDRNTFPNATASSACSIA